MNIFIHRKVDCSEIVCVGFSNSKNSNLLPGFLMYDYLHVNYNIEISCLNLNNLRIINCIKILATKFGSMGLKSLQAKFQLSLIDERKHLFL